MKPFSRPLVGIFTGTIGAVLLAFAATAAQTAKLPSAVGFVLNEGGDALTIIDPADGSVLGVPDVETSLHKPHLAAYDAESRRLYVGNKGANLAVFDLSDPLVPKLVADVTPGGDGEIHSVVLAAGLVWLAHEGDSAVYAYDPANLDTPAVTLGADQGFNAPHGLTLRPGSNELWATNRPMEAPGFVLRIDTQTRSVIGTPLETTGRPGDRPNNIAFTPDGSRAYVVNNGEGATEITLIDVASFQVTGQIEQDAEQGLAPHAIVYDPGTGRMLVANKDGGTISAIDTATDTVVGYVVIGEEPHCLSFGTDGRVYGTERQGGTVTVIDPATLAVALRITDPALGHPHQAVFTAEVPASP